ncbi:hypothetical protein CIB84_008014 [Bambusicola thoracicus]|uniref:Uncharacterized protein n=1 Tax=Bambusicola thoracicus TaxID=9083 RepID=A0A2P4SVY7_BAMTH|nr:hypothetical protein CIB84_008014 [Bambusicola thoracicus]
MSFEQRHPSALCLFSPKALQMGEMSKSTSDALIGRQKDAGAEHDPEELDVQNRSTEVTFETKDYEVTAGCIAASSESSGTSSDGQDEDDQNEMCFVVSLSPRGIRTSRKRPKIKSKQSPVQKKMGIVEVEEEPLLPVKAEAAEGAAQEWENRAEVAQEAAGQCVLSDMITLVILILVFMAFMHLALAVMVMVCC